MIDDDDYSPSAFNDACRGWLISTGGIDFNLPDLRARVTGVPDVEESYPKPIVLTPEQEQDRLWKLLVQAAKN